MASTSGNIHSKAFAFVFEKNRKRKQESASKYNSSNSSNHNNAAGTEEIPNKKTRPAKKQRPPKKRPSALDASTTNNSSKKKKLSQKALDLSSVLKSYSQRKRLAEALEVYWDKANDDIRDGFHACITIDCCARCGAMDEVEKILEALKTSGQAVSIETNTSAIKGFSHAGDIARACQIFEAMCREKNNKNLRPNVRTLNTLLRGCLWTAATLDDQDRICGGVISSETAWNLYKNGDHHGIKKPPRTTTKVSSSSAQVDVSSYEYTISLLCQALRIEDAEQRIEELKTTYQLTTDGGRFDGGNPSDWETVAVAYLGLGRAKALLGRKDGALEACRLARRAIEVSKKLQESDTSRSSSRQESGGRIPRGEKRAWKSDNDNRTTSNAMFRNHRMEEMGLELSSIVGVCEAVDFPPAKNVLACRVVNGLFYFSGGGTTKLNVVPNNNGDNKTETKSAAPGRRLRRHVVNASWLSFGLDPALKRGEFDDLKLPNDFMRVRDSERIYRIVGKDKQAIQDDGFIDFSKVFPGEPKPLDIELGSGHGDWAVHQAASMPNRNHVAVELRADRVFQIFSKAYLRLTGPLENLCVMGDDCSSFLLERVKPGSAATIFANHPEPPTQVHGKTEKDLQAIMDGNPEPAHMLNSRALIAAGNCLQDSSSSSGIGRIVIVTDNINYARLICATVVKINWQQSSCRLRSCRLDLKSSGLREIESFPPKGSKRGKDTVVLLEGQPCSFIGHAVSRSSVESNGSSYFDRLWRTGASGHASRRERYLIVLERW